MEFNILVFTLSMAIIVILCNRSKMSVADGHIFISGT